MHILPDTRAVALLDAALAVADVDPATASTYLVAAAQKFEADGKPRAACAARSLARDFARLSLPTDPATGVDLPVVYS
jgi:hypothetical protein